MSNSFDVIVVGGGVVGLSAAIAMSQYHFSVGLIDAGLLTATTSEPDPRVYAINRASQSLLQKLEAWDDLDLTRSSPYRHMHVWDAATDAHIDFDARMIADDRLGTIIEECIIKQALLQRLTKQEIKTFSQSRITAISHLPGGIEISDGSKTWQAKLLIIADGAMSATRQLLEVPLTTWSYHQQAIVSLIRTEKPHQATAYQVFNPDGPLAFLPLADPHQCSIVWSTTTSHAKALMTLPDDQFATHLETAFAKKLGHCEVLDKRHQFPLHMRHAKQYTGPHWLLMGDAAHTIHPLAGLGLNIGLADLAAWIKHLDADKTKAWSNKTLGAYQRERKHAVWQMIALMEGLKTLFANPLPAVATLRGLGLQACNHLLPLKRLFIEQAAG